MIQVGQDALGGWAWMLHGSKGLVQSGDNLRTMEAAVDAAGEAWAEAKIRGEPGIGDRPRFSFPDAEGGAI